MSYIVYFIPLVAIAGMVGYMVYYQAVMKKAVAEGKGPLMFHNTYAGQFTSLHPQEYIIALWMGIEFQEGSTAGRIASSALNAISRNVIGVSTYVPNVYVAISSFGRLFVSREYSEDGQRGNFQEYFVWGPGTTASTGPTAFPQPPGLPPTNPFNPVVALQPVMLHNLSGTTYPLWLSPQSAMLTGQSLPIYKVLPMTAGQAAQIWERANSSTAVPA